MDFLSFFSKLFFLCVALEFCMCMNRETTEKIHFVKSYNCHHDKKFDVKHKTRQSYFVKNNRLMTKDWHTVNCSVSFSFTFCVEITIFMSWMESFERTANNYSVRCWNCVRWLNPPSHTHLLSIEKQIIKAINCSEAVDSFPNLWINSNPRGLQTYASITLWTHLMMAIVIL